MNGLEWYWWALIFIGIFVMNYIRVKVSRKIMENSKKRNEKNKKD